MGLATKQRTPDGPATPAVVGLDAGRQRAQRRHRRRRAISKIWTVIGVTLVVGIVAGAGYIGYEVWLTEEGWNTDGNERRYTDDELLDLTHDLSNQPAWNGPGNPTFGVGEKVEQP